MEETLKDIARTLRSIAQTLQGIEAELAIIRCQLVPEPPWMKAEPPAPWIATGEPAQPPQGKPPWAA
jgi:hypothetical protein